MNFSTSVLNVNNGQNITVFYNSQPDECCICHIRMKPYGPLTGLIKNANVQLIYMCTSLSCNKLFISDYIQQGNQNQFAYTSSAPIKHVGRNFNQVIKDISPSFVEIYNQSLIAEEQKLLQICGVGYRKSVEFLIKDYLKNKKPDQAEAIEKMQLGNCIKDLVDDPKIKDVAKRAVWLGNDETHYVRRWEDKDLTHLKQLINLTLHWVEMEYTTAQMISEMPEA